MADADVNVALVIESLDGGGSERVVQRLALGLAQRGQRVHVYCLRGADVPLEPLAAAGITVREAHSVGRDPLLAARLAWWLRRDRVQLVHAHSCAALAWAFPAARMLGLPLVHVWHGWPLAQPTRYHRLAEVLDRFVNGVGVNSQALRARLPIRRIADTATYLPNGIDLPCLAPADARRRLEAVCLRPLGRPLVLSVGNVRVEKDICGLLAAFAVLRRDWPTAQLVCVGAVHDYRYWRLVQRQMDTLGLGDAVCFAGACRKAWQVMAGADVFCLGSATEAMPNVALEAMSQRVPIVATAVGDIGRLPPDRADGPWLLRHNESGLLVPPGQPAALAAALDSVLRDRAAAQRRAELAHADYHRRFTTGQMVGNYESFYAAARRLRQRTRGPARTQRVLMLGPGPAQVGGMVTSINLLMDGPLSARYDLHRFATTCDTGATNTMPRGCRLAWSAWRHWNALARLITVLVRRRIDLVHIHTCSHVTFYRNLLDIAAAKLLGCRVVVHIRGGQFERFCRMAGPTGGWLIRRGLQAADAILVLSAHWREMLAPYTGTTRVYVVPSAVRIAALPARRAAQNGPCRFLYLAALTHAKGLGDLITAAAHLRRTGVQFKLVVAGPATGDALSVWRERVASAGLADVTLFTGTVQGPQKTQLLATADCFVHPSHSEGLPNAILEAAAAGLPVIATAVGSVPEVLEGDHERRGLLVPPQSPDHLAAAMQTLAGDANLRARLAAALHAHVAGHYGLPEVSSRVARVYEGLLSHRRRRAQSATPIASSARQTCARAGVQPAGQQFLQEVCAP